MQHYIIDTNVFVVANGQTSQMSEKDVGVCEEFIISLYNKAIIYVDSEFLIFDEYFRNVNRAGQPGIGDAFVKWLFDNQCNKNVCKIVKITPLNNEATSFLEIPFAEELKNFDQSDRKFVAVAVVSLFVPEICNASDSDWWDYDEMLKKFGIRVKYLCPDQLEYWQKNRT